MSQRLFIHSKSMKRNTGILEHLVQPSYQQSFESLSLSYKQIPLSFILLDSLLLHNPSISLHISPTRTPLLMSFYVSHLILYLLLSVSIQSIIFLFIFLNPIPLFFLISWGMVCEWAVNCLPSQFKPNSHGSWTDYLPSQQGKGAQDKNRSFSSDSTQIGSSVHQQSHILTLIFIFLMHISLTNPSSKSFCA